MFLVFSKQSAQVYHSERENLMSSSSQDPISTGKPVALFSSKNRSSQEVCSDREDFSSEHQQVLGNNEPIFKIIPSRTQRLSEVRKHESRADFLDNSVRDLHRQLDFNRLGIYCTNQGHEESRKGQARLHEELTQRERVLRETQIRSIHELGELKRHQEMRRDEFSTHKLRESHVTIQKLTSQIQEFQERVNLWMIQVNFNI